MKQAVQPTNAVNQGKRTYLYSNNRRLSIVELQEVMMLLSPTESSNEPWEISMLRQSFNSRMAGALHLVDQKIPAIIDSYDYEILKHQGRV